MTEATGFIILNVNSHRWLVVAYGTAQVHSFPTESVVLAPAAASGSLLEMQNLGSHPDLLTQNMHFNNIPKQVVYIWEALP